MKLQRLAGLERKKIEDELNAVQALIKELKEILGSPKKILSVIKSELKEISEKYGDERRTKIVKHAAKNFSIEDTIPDEESVLVLTAGGYVKRTRPEEYRKQRRGGVGVVDLETKEEDFVTILLTANTHSDLLFFTNLGKVFQMKMYDLPEARRATRGKSIMNFLQLGSDEKVTSILPMPKEVKKSSVPPLLMVTKNGTAKKTAGDGFRDVRRSGLIAIKLTKGDELQSVHFVNNGDEVIMATTKGQSIHFKESDIRLMGRTAGGVRAMKIGKGDSVIGVDTIKSSVKDGFFLTMSQNGLGKKTALKEYKVQKRGGSGIKTAKITPKTGDLIVGRVIREEEELIAMSKKGQVVRVQLGSVPALRRSTQGVTIMKMRPGDGIASLTCL